MDRQGVGGVPVSPSESRIRFTTHLRPPARKHPDLGTATDQRASKARPSFVWDSTMETDSILFRTLVLFASTIVAAALTFALVV